MDKDCLIEGSYKYSCSSITKGCTITDNICDPKYPQNICN